MRRRYNFCDYSALWKVWKCVFTCVGKWVGKSFHMNIVWCFYSYLLCGMMATILQSEGHVTPPRPPPAQKGKVSLKLIHTFRFCLLVADKSWHELAMLCSLSVQEKLWKRFCKLGGLGGGGVESWGAIVALWRWGAEWTTDNSNTTLAAQRWILLCVHCTVNLIVSQTVNSTLQYASPAGLERNLQTVDPNI